MKETLDKNNFEYTSKISEDIRKAYNLIYNNMIDEAYQILKKIITDDNYSNKERGIAYFECGKLLLKYNNLEEITVETIANGSYNKNIWIDYLIKAADYGLDKGIKYLFNYYFFGLGGIKDKKEALKYSLLFEEKCRCSFAPEIEKIFIDVFNDPEAYIKFLYEDLYKNTKYPNDCLVKITECYVDQKNNIFNDDIKRIGEKAISLIPDKYLFKVIDNLFYYSSPSSVEELLAVLVERNNISAKWLYKYFVEKENSSSKIELTRNEQILFMCDVDTKVADLLYENKCYEEAYHWYLEYAARDVKYAYFMLGKMNYLNQYKDSNLDSAHFFFHSYLDTNINLYGKMGEYFLSQNDIDNAYRYFREGYQKGDQLSIYYIRKEFMFEDYDYNLLDMREICVNKNKGNYDIINKYNKKVLENEITNRNNIYENGEENA